MEPAHAAPPSSADPNHLLRRHEVAFVLRRPERSLGRLVRERRLVARFIGRSPRFSARDAEAVIGDDPLAHAVLRGIVEGRVAAPRAARPTALPPPLAEVVEEL